MILFVPMDNRLGNGISTPSLWFVGHRRLDNMSRFRTVFQANQRRDFVPCAERYIDRMNSSVNAPMDEVCLLAFSLLIGINLVHTTKSTLTGSSVFSPKDFTALASPQ